LKFPFGNFGALSGVYWLPSLKTFLNDSAFNLLIIQALKNILNQDYFFKNLARNLQHYKTKLINFFISFPP